VSLPGLAPALQRRLGALLEAAARWLALAGGLVLVALAAMTLASVTGRALIWLGLGPIPGDFELVEAGCAFAIFAFLPWCTLRRGHATVDIFVTWTGPRGRAGLSLIGNLLLALVAAILAWQLWLGLVDKQSYDETTFILQFPVWWGYAAVLPGAVLFPLAALAAAWRSLNELAGTGEA
jgi:TRAP-type C4-dicarboxylate transport system permease small subunit